jgi:hypothetical protein
MTTYEITCRVSEYRPTEVMLLVNGTPIFSVPYQVARQVARAMLQQALRAEGQDDHKKQMQVVDVAAALQGGCPFPLTGDPAVIAEAAKLLPGAGNIPDGSKVGTPMLVGHRGS